MMNATTTKINSWNIARFVTPTAFTPNGQRIEGGKTVVNFYSSLNEIETYGFDKNGNICNLAQWVPIKDVSIWNTVVEAYETHAARGTFQRHILS